MKAKKINLANPIERKVYSKKLQLFEQQFTYPLGEQCFKIIHGTNSSYDYFSFFEQLGEPQVFIVEKNDKIICALCAILRDLKDHRAWYLCDYKMLKEYRGQKVYRKILFKYLWRLYLQCPNFFAINMNGVENNRFVQYLKNIFKLLKIDARELYLHSMCLSSLQQLRAQEPHFWQQYAVVSNRGKKEMMIEEQCCPTYHLIKRDIIEKRQQVLHLKELTLDEIPTTSKVMFLSRSYSSLCLDDQVQKISFIGKNCTDFEMSSAEI